MSHLHNSILGQPATEHTAMHFRITNIDGWVQTTRSDHLAFELNYKIEFNHLPIIYEFMGQVAYGVTTLLVIMDTYNYI